MKTRNIVPKAKHRLDSQKPASKLSEAGRNHFRSIDGRTSGNVLLSNGGYGIMRTFRQEYRYALPPNIGDARNPLVFGKIPQEYQDAEIRENKLAVYNALVKPFHAKLAKTMYFRHDRRDTKFTHKPDNCPRCKMLAEKSK